VSWQKNNKPIQKGDLVKFHVPPFSVGIAVDVIDWWGGSQILAVMFNPHEYEKVIRGSRIPKTSLIEIERFFSVGEQFYAPIHFQQRERVESLLDAYTVPTNPDDHEWILPGLRRRDGKFYATTKPIAVINTHMDGLRIIRTVSSTKEES